MEKRLGRNFGEKLLEGSGRPGPARVEGRGAFSENFHRQPPTPPPAVQHGLGLGGAGRMAAALLLHLLLINNVFGARTQLLCLLRTPAESASLQPLGNMGAPCDLAAASEFVPKDQRSILELQAYSPAGFSTWGRDSSCCVSGLRDEGVGLRKSGLRPWRGLRFFLSHGEARVEKCRFRNLPGRVWSCLGTCLKDCFSSRIQNRVPVSVI